MASATKVYTTRLDEKLAAELDAMAVSTRRSKAFLIQEAVANYVAVNAWQVRAIAEALAEVRATGDKGVPQEEMETWVDSWDTPDEKPMPGNG